MSIGIRQFELKQLTDPLKVGANTITIEFIGIVDEANENDVAVVATIDADAPIVFKETGNSRISYDQKFPVGKEGECSNELVLKVNSVSPEGAAAKISIVYTTPQGKKRRRFPTVTF